MRNQCKGHSGVNACQSEAVACNALLLEKKLQHCRAATASVRKRSLFFCIFLGAFAHMDDDHHCLTENSLPAERNIRVADHHAHHVLSASRRMNSVPRLTGFHSTFASAYTALLRYEPGCFGWVCFGWFVFWVGCLLVGFVVWCLALLLGSYLLSVSI